MNRFTKRHIVGEYRRLPKTGRTLWLFHYFGITVGGKVATNTN